MKRIFSIAIILLCVVFALPAATKTHVDFSPGEKPSVCTYPIFLYMLLDSIATMPNNEASLFEKATPKERLKLISNMSNEEIDSLIISLTNNKLAPFNISIKEEISLKAIEKSIFKTINENKLNKIYINTNDKLFVNLNKMYPKGTDVPPDDVYDYWRNMALRAKMVY